MGMTCPACGKSELIQIQVDDNVSLAGILAALIFICGVVLLMVSLKLGLIIMAFAIALGLIGRPKHTELICPICKHTIKL